MIHPTTTQNGIYSYSHKKKLDVDRRFEGYMRYKAENLGNALVFQ